MRCGKRGGGGGAILYTHFLKFILLSEAGSGYSYTGLRVQPGYLARLVF